MHEPFHLYHNRRQLERDTAMPTLDTPAVTVRLRRHRSAGPAPSKALRLGLLTIFAMLIERLSA